jgi:hypothetical protein
MAAAYVQPRGSEPVLEGSASLIDSAHVNEFEAAKSENNCDLFVNCMEVIRGLNSEEDISNSGGLNSKCTHYYQLCQNRL